MSTKSYPSDLSLAQWKILEALLPSKSPMGRSREYTLHTLTAISFRRVRPVLVTGCTTVLAMLPLVLQSEHGFWRTLGATVIGGVVWSSFFLVLTVPILLLLFARRPKQVPASLEALQSEQ